MRLPCLASVVLLACLGAAPVQSAAPPGTLEQEVAGLGDAGLDTAQFDDLLDRVRGSGDQALEAQAWMHRCHALVNVDLAQARKVADAGVPVARAAGASEALGGLLLCRAYTAEMAGELDAALADYEAALAASTLAGDRAGAAQARTLRGEVQYQRGRFAEAQADLQAAYREFVALGNERQQLYTLNAMANVYADARVGQYTQALDYYRQLLALHTAAGRDADAATSQFNIATTLLGSGDLAGAEREFRIALATFERLGDDESVAETQRSMAALYNRMDRPAEALPLAGLALAHALASDDAPALASARLTRSAALRALGRHAEAASELAQARRYYERQDSPRYLERMADETALLAAAEGRWQDAYEARGEQRSLGERLRRQLDDELTARLRVQFDSERQEQENVALAREGELRAAALADGERIRLLQGIVIALATLLAIILGVRAWQGARQARAMRTLALTDELTGLANRRAILQDLQARLEAPQRPPVAVLMLDIDHFKAINDRLGHDVGDDVLRRVSRVLRETLGTDGRLGRIGGEEFLVVLAPGVRASQAEVAERLRQAVATAPGDPPVRISLGGSVATATGQRSEDLLKRADLALYRAKGGGRDRVEIEAV